MNQASLETVSFARLMRSQSTEAEQRLWSQLRARRFGGFKFRRQHPADCYMLDFFCVERNLAIELDGGGHNEDAQRTHDADRDAFFSVKGIRTLRFWNDQVLQRTDDVLAVIWEALHAASSPHPAPLAAPQPAARITTLLLAGKALRSPAPLRGEGTSPASFPLRLLRPLRGEGELN